MSLTKKIPYATGLTLYVFVYARSGSSAGQVWNGTAFEAWDASNWTSYAIACTEDASAGIYMFTLPEGLGLTTVYDLIVFVQSGETEASSDQKIFTGTIGPDSDGAVLGATGLDNVLVESSITASAALVDDSASQLTSINGRQALALIQAACCSILAGATGTTITIAATGKSATNRITATVDASGNRSAVNLQVPN